jgi:hypothetical protein
MDAPEQALLLHVIRSVAPPSGAFQADYQRTEDRLGRAGFFNVDRGPAHFGGFSSRFSREGVRTPTGSRATVKIGNRR